MKLSKNRQFEINSLKKVDRHLQSDIKIMRLKYIMRQKNFVAKSDIPPKQLKHIPPFFSYYLHEINSLHNLYIHDKYEIWQFYL